MSRIAVGQKVRFLRPVSPFSPFTASPSPIPRQQTTNTGSRPPLFYHIFPHKPSNTHTSHQPFFGGIAAFFTSAGFGANEPQRCPHHARDRNERQGSRAAGLPSRFEMLRLATVLLLGVRGWMVWSDLVQKLNGAYFESSYSLMLWGEEATCTEHSGK
jgi:hypothetical protein